MKRLSDRWLCGGPPDGGDDLVAHEKLAAGMRPDWQAHDCRVTLRAMRRSRGIVNLSVRGAEGRRFFSEVRSGRSACLGDLAPNPELALARSAAAVGSDGFGIGNVEEIRYLIVNR